jgi:TonB family protein
MIRFGIALYVLAFAWFALSSSQRSNDICVVHLESMAYGPLARQTRVQGDVRVSFQIEADGKVGSVSVLSGHPLLARDAAQNLNSWVFSRADGRTHEIVYEFRLENPEVYTDPPSRVTFDLPDRVRIVSNFKTISH